MRRRDTGATAPDADAILLVSGRDPVIERNTTGPLAEPTCPAGAAKVALEAATAGCVPSPIRPPWCSAIAPSATVRRIGTNAEAAPTGADAIRRPDAAATGLPDAGGAIMARPSTGPREDESDACSDAVAWSLGIVESERAGSVAVAETASAPKNLRMTAPGPR
jgi:hypothetical protein